MSNRADKSYELFYNAAKGVVGDAIAEDENAAVLDKLNSLVSRLD